MTDVIPSLLNLQVYDVNHHELFSASFRYALEYENSFSILQASICPIWLESQLFANLLSCELLVLRNSVKAESVFL